jgi:hypothetical protein
MMRDILAAQDDRHANGHAGARHVSDRLDLDVQHGAIHEQHSAERLVLRRGADVPIRCEPSKKCRDFGSPISDGCRFR